MTKKIILSTIAATTLVTSLNASRVDDKIIALEKLIKAQQEQINELKASIEDVDSDLDERLEAVEVRSFTDKIQMGLGMRVEMNNYNNTYADGTDYKANDIWRTKLNINMRAKIADNLKFTGRLSMYKNWGDSTARMVQNDSMQGRKPDSSAVYAERAYLDWMVNPGSEVPLIVTLGRQPSSDGPSYQVKEDTTRKGTYDALAFDGAADGIVLTANLDKVLSGTSVRIAYGTPNVQDNKAGANQMNYAGADNTGFENTKVTGVFLDQTFKSLPFNNLVQVYHVSAKDLNGDAALATDKNVGDLTISGFMIEATKIKLGGGLDLFAHYAKSNAKPNGERVTVATGTHGLLTSTAGDTASKSGDAIWVGARYTINSDWKIGAEYNKGSKNWFSFTSGANDPLNKLATRGEAIEAYITKTINRNANLRVGYVDIDYEYTGSGSHLGAPTKITNALGTGAIKETQNAYMTFNVLF
jgi:hypothetical protein